MSEPFMKNVHASTAGEAPPDIAHAAAPVVLERWHPLTHIHHIVGSVVTQSRHTDGAGTVRVIRAAILQCLYSLSCAEQFMEHLRYNTLYRWFVGLSDGEQPWSAAAYVHTLTNLAGSEEGAGLLRTALVRAHTSARLSPRHFSIDQTMFERYTATADTEFTTSMATQSDAESWNLARLDRARAIILRRIGDGDLTPDAIASEMCMSRRALFLLFEKHGLTPTRVIRDLRLDHCRRLLLDARHRRRKITDIAMDFGFASACTFSRQFKDRFGISAMELRFAERGKSLGSRMPRFAGIAGLPART